MLNLLPRRKHGLMSVGSKTDVTLMFVEALERAEGVDWVEVQALCRRTRDRLQQESPPDYTDEFVYVFLDDAHLRQEDKEYAQVQRERLSNWLDGSAIISR